MMRYLCSGILMLVMAAPAQLLAQQQLKVGQDAELRSNPKWDVAALDSGVFGDRQNLYTGETEFFVTDASVPGNNGLEVAVHRRLSRLWKHDTILADWELDFPRLEGIFSSAGWQVSTTGARDKRCSVDRQNFMQATPPTVSGTSIGSQPASFAFASEEYWYGNNLHLPDTGDQRMLVLTPENTSFSHGSYYWITRENWVFSCLQNTANGKPGEAFVARAPDGRSYRFDWLVELPFKPIEKSSTAGGLGSLTSRLTRKKVMLYPTEVTDENGNWVRYQFDASNQLISISSSDGRLIQFSYANGRLSSFTTAGKTWTYIYGVNALGGPKLAEVVLPDQSKWILNLELNNVEVTYPLHSTACANETGAVVGGTMQGHMIHPSGLRGDFHFLKRYHGITFTPRTCVPNGYGGMTMLRPDRYPVVSMTKKVFSGPGIAAQTWDFDYGWTFSQPNLIAGYLDTCANQACPSTRVVTTTKSDGSWEKRTFNSVFGDTEGSLVKLEIGEGGSVLRAEAITYETGANQPFPVVYGKDPCHRCHRSHERIVPAREKRIEQQGKYFYWRVDSFDSFARPLLVSKYSTPVQ